VFGVIFKEIKGIYCWCRGCRGCKEKKGEVNEEGSGWESAGSRVFEK
jgi:hypothetical protein